MILRRITEHVKAQNWFAVGLDFLIVVIGVFFGLQASNWNDAARMRALEQSYISRTAEDLRSSISTFEAELEAATASRRALERFISAIEAPSTPDAELLSATQGYLTEGVFLAAFSPTRATFEELRSTGNLDIIRDRQLREALIDLDTFYESSNGSFSVNLAFVSPADADYIMRVDAFLFDARLADVIAERSPETWASYIRANRALMTRHAAMHYWLKDRAIEILTGAIDETQAVLNRIEADQ